LKEKLITGLNAKISGNVMIVDYMPDIIITLKSYDDFVSVSQILFEWHEDCRFPKFEITKNIKTFESIINAIKSSIAFWKKWL
jgi:hypothetical protein